jgi:tol-pal system protein YbgF
MRQTESIRYLAVVLLALFLAGCTETYAYLPSMGKQAPASGAEAQPAPATEPAPALETPAPKPDLAQQVQSLEARVQQMENRLAQMEARPAAPAVRAKEHHGATPVAAPAAAAGTAADKVYAEGLRLYQAKKFPPARTKFSQYLKEQPKGPKAPEARYHLADSFYQEGKYQEAAVEFNKLASQSPKSILAPAALLRQALAYQNLHQTASYRNTLNKLVQAYPKSPEAKEAGKWLKDGKKEAPAKAPVKTAPKPE